MNDLTPLERALFAVIGQEEFASACRNAFAGQSGTILRSALCSVAHPFFPPVGKDALETYRQIGRAEIVTLLLRFSEPEATPAVLIQSYERTNQTETSLQPEGGKPTARRGRKPRTNPALSTDDK